MAGVISLDGSVGPHPRQDPGSPEGQGKWSVGAKAIVKVILRNGTSHCDIGWGEATNVREHDSH